MESIKLVALRDALDAAAAKAAQFVQEERLAIFEAQGTVLAADVVAAKDVPDASRALRAGFAVRAGDTIDASVMAPIPLPALPLYVAADQELPPETDAILPPHAIRADAAGGEAMTTANPWDYVRRRGADASAGSLILRAGSVLNETRIAVLGALGIDKAVVKRPKLAMLDGTMCPVAPVLRHLIRGWGALVTGSQAADVAIALVNERQLPEARTAIALQPGLGETRLFLESGRPPVISLPARAEAALALAYAFVRPLIDRLTGRKEPRIALTLPIDRKIAVSAGLSNVILLAAEADCWRVIASGDLPLSALARANALAVLGPECEGLAPGALLRAHLLTDTQ